MWISQLRRRCAPGAMKTRMTNSLRREQIPRTAQVVTTPRVGNRLNLITTNRRGMRSMVRTSMCLAWTVTICDTRSGRQGGGNLQAYSDRVQRKKDCHGNVNFSHFANQAESLPLTATLNLHHNPAQKLYLGTVVSANWTT